MTHGPSQEAIHSGISARNTVNGQERNHKFLSEVLCLREQQTGEFYFLGNRCSV